MARAAAVALFLLGVVGVLAPVAEASWGRPFRFAQPFSLDVLPPQIAFSQVGGAAVAFGVQDVDDPATSKAYAAWRAANGRLSRPRRVPAAQDVLSLAFDGGALELLTGNSAAGDACCGSVSVVRMTSAKSFGHPHRLIRGLTGATTGQLLSVSGRLVATIATERGVWVGQSSRSGRFGLVHLLTGSDARPESLSAAALAGGGAIVGWIERDRRSSVARKVFVATGSARSLPGRPHAALSVPSGHRIDQLALVGSFASPRGGATVGGPTVAWVESWYDRHGSYRSQVEVADVARARHARSFRVPGEVASGLSFAQDAKGDQLLSWKACAPGGDCSVREALRRANRRFDRPRRLGSMDAAAVPAAALAGSGEGLVGWIDHGRVLAADLRRTATRFAASHIVSGADFAADLNLSFGPTGSAIAVWSQGTFAPDVMGAVYRPG